MTDVNSAEWADVVETLERDIAVVSAEDSEDGAVREALDEVWSIVDDAQDRVGSVDAEQIADVLDIDVDESSTDVTVESIPHEFVRDDPQRAAELSRLVTLMTLDESSDYDFGRLWSEDRVVGSPSGADDGEPDTGEEDGSRSSGDDDESDDDEEHLRSELGDAFSGLRDRIQDAREGLQASSDRSEDSAGPGTETERTVSTDTSSSSGQRSTTTNRRFTTFSTLPSDRHDLGTLPHVSTVPGRGGPRPDTSGEHGTGDGSKDGS